MRPLLALSLALLLPACAVPEGGDSQFGRIDRIDRDGTTDLGDGGAAVDPTDPDGPDAESPDDPADDDDDTGAWDPAEPEVADGTIVVFEVQCGLLIGEPRMAWMKVDTYWKGLMSEDDSQAFADLEVCFRESDTRLDWADDGFIYILAGGVGHDAEPTEVAGRWFGSVYPLVESSAECDEALAARGMRWPVDFGLRLVEQIDAE